MRLKQYIRDEETQQPFGVMLADKIEGGIVFGWSLVHLNDNFNKALGDKIATGRLAACKPDQALVVPAAIVEDLEVFIKRAVTYYRLPSETVVIDGYLQAIQAARRNS